MTAPRMPNAADAPVAVRMSGIVKTFGDVVANRGASLEVKRGEIHALVGENGAGKSTLMRILSGMYGSDAGRVVSLHSDIVH
jgi:ABC-type sugar transport system ATPase subunit